MYHYFIRTETVQESMKKVKDKNNSRKNRDIHIDLSKIDHLIAELEDDLHCFSMFIHVF